MTKLVKNGIFVIRMVYMKKTYKVAGHVLSLEMPDGNVWQQMKNLVPFEIGEASPLIAFRQVENLAEQAPQPLLVSDDEGFPMITIGKTENGKWYFTMAPLNNLPVSCNCVASEDFSEVDFQIVNPRQAVFSINDDAGVCPQDSNFIHSGNTRFRCDERRERFCFPGQERNR